MNNLIYRDFMRLKLIPMFSHWTSVQAINRNISTTKRDFVINKENVHHDKTIKPTVGEILQPEHEVDNKITKEIIGRVNEKILSGTAGRLFAVVKIAGKQFKVTAEDMILLQANFPANVGEKLILEKILLLGSKDFTLIGHPLLSKEMIRIEATVIEKTLSQIITYFRMKRREQYRRILFYRQPHTVLRINSITLNSPLNETNN